MCQLTNLFGLTTNYYSSFIIEHYFYLLPGIKVESLPSTALKMSLLTVSILEFWLFLQLLLPELYLGAHPNLLSLSFLLLSVHQKSD